MNTKLVTVFGGSGFLGRHTVRALAKAGWRIKIATRHPASGFFLRPLGSVGQIDFVKCDVADAESVATAVMGASAVINLTGILFQSARLSRMCRRMARKTSPSGRRGRVSRRWCIFSAIGANADLGSEYARTKAAGEQAVRDSFPGAVILRPSIVFGPEDGFFNKFAAMARMLPVLPLVGRRSYPFPAGVRGRCRGRHCHGAGVAGRAWTHLRTWRAQHLFLQGTAATDPARNRPPPRRLFPCPSVWRRFQAAFLQLLPKPVLTMDQVKLLKTDNIVAPTAAGLADLGITPTSVEAVVPSYLWRYRAKGEYANDARTGMTGLSQGQVAKDRQPGHDPVPAERRQAVTADEADESLSPPPAPPGTSTTKPMAMSFQAAAARRITVLVDVQHRRTQHGGHRQIEGEKRRRRPRHAQQFAAQDGGAGTRHAGEDRQHLAQADLERLFQWQAIAIGETRLRPLRSSTRIRMPPATRAKAMTGARHPGENRTFLITRAVQQQPAMTDGMKATSTARVNCWASREVGSLIRTSRNLRQCTATTARMAPNWMTTGKTSPGAWKAQHIFGDQQMGGGGNRQEFRQAFDNAQNRGQQRIIHGSSRVRENT